MTVLRVPDRRWAAIGGTAAILLGTWLLTQAFEARGRSRPLWARVLPAV